MLLLKNTPRQITNIVGLNLILLCYLCYLRSCGAIFDFPHLLNAKISQNIGYNPTFPLRISKLSLNADAYNSIFVKFVKMPEKTGNTTDKLRYFPIPFTYFGPFFKESRVFQYKRIQDS